MTEEEMKSLIRQADALGTHNVVFTGGEPTLLGPVLPQMLRFVRRDTGIRFTRIVTNAHWATSYERAREILGEWQEAGLDELNLSTGEYHQRGVPLDRVAHAYNAAIELDFPTVTINVELLVEGKGLFSKERLTGLLQKPLLGLDEQSYFTRRHHGVRYGSVMRFGRGKSIPEDSVCTSPEESLIHTCEHVLKAIAMQPDGSVTACCGVMVREPSLLTIGNWREDRLEDIMIAAQSDLVLNWIRHVGLIDMKKWLRGKDSSIAFRDHYTNLCDLCAEIVMNPTCEALLLASAEEQQGHIIANRIARTVRQEMVQPSDAYRPWRETEVA